MSIVPNKTFTPEPSESWQYVTIPQEDPLGKTFANVSIQRRGSIDIFEAGKTYKVPSAYAELINERIKIYNKSCVRLLQPNTDIQSQMEVAAGSAVAGRYATPVDTTTIQTL